MKSREYLARLRAEEPRYVGLVAPSGNAVEAYARDVFGARSVCHHVRFAGPVSEDDVAWLLAQTNCFGYDPRGYGGRVERREGCELLYVHADSSD